MKKLFKIVHTKDDSFELYVQKNMLMSINRSAFLELKKVIDIAYENTRISENNSEETV